ncbi:universal stress protein [Thiotrichales bacterium 19S3-7]|nr:universal stress protein [Thiotrichales bacterium 19S3-7]MCF6802041.1 universal stress protein [Thiotrichales bacterium 19S3-11]
MEYKNILVAINVFEDYQHIFHSAQSVAEKFNAKLTVFMVITASSGILNNQSSYDENLEKQANETLDSLTKNARLKQINFVIKIGKAHSLISKYAKENHYDLIILGSHGYYGINSLLGSTSNSVLHNAPCDTLIIRITENAPKTASIYNKILLATDFEHDDEQLTKQAKIVANHYGVSLNALTVIKNITSPISSSDYSVIPDVRRDLLKETKIKFSTWLKEQNIASKAMCVIGEPSFEIANYANKKNIDLTILGSHNRSFIGRFFIGSTANAILHQIKKDVLVIRLKK